MQKQCRGDLNCKTEDHTEDMVSFKDLLQCLARI